MYAVRISGEELINALHVTLRFSFFVKLSVSQHIVHAAHRMIQINHKKEKLFYLSMVHLTTLLIVQVLQRQMIGLVNNELQKI
jgi:hypothetical protein